MVAHAFNPSTQGAEAYRSLSSMQSGIQSKIQDSQSYMEKPCLEKQECKVNLKIEENSGCWRLVVAGTNKQMEVLDSRATMV